MRKKKADKTEKNVDEEHGILTREDIVDACSYVLAKFDVKFAYIFGSYAKGNATPVSDVDLLVSTEVTGLRFFGLVEELRNALRKKVDVLDMNQLRNNLQLTEEILNNGMKIYEQRIIN